MISFAAAAPLDAANGLVVQPAPGRLVRDPITRVALPAEAPSIVPRSTYWLRRLADGDVVLVTASPPAAALAAAAPASSRTARKESST
jgi:hypothetical protein